ncbi:carboxymuconolactone decarboxylase family protein [Effusibacillus consociatus]|uniref:Carboxymuconolactone decarboxylase family protein n=1 Tax=Effusibacillus consociatus TaxID=1117041 RepID=A0ABV9Q6S1_9BACL
MDINAAVGSGMGIPTEKILALPQYKTSQFYDEREKLVLEYTDAITLSDKDVDDDLFEQLRSHFEEDEIVELTAVIARENFSSKFNRALRIPSQGFFDTECSSEA